MRRTTERRRFAAVGAVDQTPRVGAEQPEEIRPPPLRIPHEGCVIDDATGIGVLEIDPDRQDVALPIRVADDAACDVRPRLYAQASPPCASPRSIMTISGGDPKAHRQRAAQTARDDQVPPVFDLVTVSVPRSINRRNHRSISEKAHLAPMRVPGEGDGDALRDVGGKYPAHAPSE